MSIDDLPQRQIDELCTRLLDEHSEGRECIYQFIFKCPISASFWASHFDTLYPHFYLCDGPSNCPVEIARAGGAPDHMLHKLCRVDWPTIEANKWGWDCKSIFECVQEEPFYYRSLVPDLLAVVERLIGDQIHRGDGIMAELIRVGVKCTPEMSTFLNGLYCMEKEEGIQMLKLVPKYSRFIPRTIDMDFSKWPTNRRWAEDVNYPREYIEWAASNRLEQSMAYNIVQNADGKDLDLINANCDLLMHLESHPLYIYLNLRKMGPLNTPIMRLFYANYVRTNLMHRDSLKPSMINAIAQETEPISKAN